MSMSLEYLGEIRNKAHLESEMKENYEIKVIWSDCLVRSNFSQCDSLHSPET